MPDTLKIWVQLCAFFRNESSNRKRLYPPSVPATSSLYARRAFLVMTPLGLCSEIPRKYPYVRSVERGSLYETHSRCICVSDEPVDTMVCISTPELLRRARWQKFMRRGLCRSKAMTSSIELVASAQHLQRGLSKYVEWRICPRELATGARKQIQGELVTQTGPSTASCAHLEST